MHPAAYYHYTSLWTNAAWSPDGRYLVLSLGVNARLPITPPTPPTPGPSPAPDCSAFGAALALPQVSVNDAGVRAAIALLNGTSLDGMSQPSMQFASSSDGRCLVVEPSDGAAASVPALTVYDCVSGRVSLQLSRAVIVPTQSGGQPISAMASSPDGTQLLLVPAGRQPHIQVLRLANLGS